jgi:hypothetical protein
MNTFARNSVKPFATKVWFQDNKLCVLLADGRELGIPLDWFPSIRDCTDEQRHNFRLIGNGRGIHWEAIDEDLSIEGLLSI